MTPIRRATAADAADLGRLLHDFNTEYDSPTPGAAVIARRAAPLLESGELVVLLSGDGPDGFAQLRLRPSLITGAKVAYLEELYVAPAHRGTGQGRALIEAAMQTAREEGADQMDLATSVDDTDAIALYERNGFTNQEGPGGPMMLFYEREL